MNNFSNVFGLDLSDKQLEQFERYYEILVEWNEFMNLTAITQREDVYTKHFMDSLSLIKLYPSLGSGDLRLIDVGTGAGFPGIPLKIAFPNLRITLLDSLGKRVKFLNHVIEELGLTDVDAIHGRAEDFARDGSHREAYDLCVSRAVANLSTLSEYCIPFVKIGGSFVSYKSEKISEEMKEASKAIDILGGKYSNQVDFTLPDTDIYRNLFEIKKIKSTSKKYPRKAGLPSKEPL